MNDNKLGTIISTLRKEKGLTQKDLADELNISDKAVSRWETGGSSPNMDMLLRISKFFTVSFNDLLAARGATDKNGDVIVQEIIEEFTEMNKKNSKRIKRVLLATVIITLILVIVIIFTNTYNRFKVYRINIENENFSSITGVYIETKIKDSLYLENIKIRNYEQKNTDTISVDLYILKDDKEIILQSYSSLDNIHFVNYQSYVEIENLSHYFDNLYLRVSIINEKSINTEYIGKLNFILDFSNNKVFYYDNTKVTRECTLNIDVNEIKTLLLKNGFEEIDNKVLQKITKEFEIHYIISSNKINYNYEKDKLSYRYTYYLNNEILEVKVFNENNTEIENYQYDSKNEKLIECKTGSCNDYKEAMKLLNKNILNLLYDN